MEGDQEVIYIHNLWDMVQEVNFQRKDESNKEEEGRGVALGEVS